MITKIRGYLADDAKRAAIAARGRARCLTAHGLAASAASFEALAKAKLSAKA